MNYNLLLGMVKAAGMTQFDLAQEIGISAATLNKKLRGHSEFTQGEIRGICKALEIPTEKIADYFFS